MGRQGEPGVNAPLLDGAALGGVAQRLRTAMACVSAALDRRPRLQPLDPRAQWPHLLALFALLLGLYLYTAPRTVVLEDDGLFILSGWFLGIEHPPGFPLYVLLAKLATLLPIGSAAWRVHAFSALAAALACVALWLIVRQLVPGRLPAWLAAAGYGVSGAFWSQALIADVYSLNVLAFFVFLLLCLRQAADARVRPPPGRLYLIALTAGLALSNHWPLFMLSATPLLLLLWQSRGVALRHAPGLTLTFAAGLLPYAWMVWRSQALPEVSFSGPIDSFSELLFHVRRHGYAGIDASVTAGWVDKLGFIRFLALEAAAQLTPVGLALALGGLAGMMRVWPPALRLGLLGAFLGPTLVLVLAIGFDDQWLQRLAFRVYPLLAWGVLALWAGLGLHLLRARLGAPLGTPAAVAAAALVIAGALVAHWQVNDRHDAWLGQEYAAAILDSLAPEAVLFVRGDTATATVGYLHRVQGRRADLTVLSEQGLVLEPRLFDPVTTPAEARKRAVRRYLERSQRPVYFLYDRGGPGVLTWLTFRPIKGGGASRAYELPSVQRALLARLVASDPLADGWDERHRRYLLARFAWFATQAQLAGAWPEGDQALADALEAALGLPEARLARAQGLMEAGIDGRREEIESLLARTGQDPGFARLEKREQARYFLLVAKVAGHAGRREVRRAALERSAAVWPHPSNPAKRLLQRRSPP